MSREESTSTQSSVLTAAVPDADWGFDKRGKKCPNKNLRECVECKAWDNRRRMERKVDWSKVEKEKASANEGNVLEALDVAAGKEINKRMEWKHEYFTCVDCVSKRECLGEAEAVAWIGGARNSRRMERAAGFKEAMDKAWEDLSFVEGNEASTEALRARGVAADTAVRQGAAPPPCRWRTDGALDAREEVPRGQPAVEAQACHRGGEGRGRGRGGGLGFRPQDDRRGGGLGDGRRSGI